MLAIRKKDIAWEDADKVQRKDTCGTPPGIMTH